MHKIHAHYVHHLPKPEEPLEPKALHLITSQSKRWFDQSWVVGAKTETIDLSSGLAVRETD